MNAALSYSRILFITFLLCLGILSCKKQSPINNNLVVINLVFSNGETQQINATGSNTALGSMRLLGKTIVQGTNDKDAVILSILIVDSVLPSNTPYLPVITPGTFDMDCEYRPNYRANGVPLYESIRGQITFTNISEKFMEGYFKGACRRISDYSDSVVITGTFKGDYIQQF